MNNHIKRNKPSAMYAATQGTERNDDSDNISHFNQIYQFDDPD
jgi:hypothetical protein